MGKTFEKCPKCSKKGFYVSFGWPFSGDGTKVCRYCHHIERPKGAPRMK